MAIVKLERGAELEFTTPGELRELFDEFAAGYLRAPSPFRDRSSVELDAAGAGSVVFEPIRAGLVFTLNRILVEVEDGSTPAAPYTAAGGYFLVKRGDLTVDFGSYVSGAGSLPALKTFTDSYAPRFRGGEKMSVQFVAGPASTAAVVSIDGELAPIPDQII